MRAFTLAVALSASACQSEPAAPSTTIQRPIRIDDGLRITYSVEPLATIEPALAVLRKRIETLSLAATVRRDKDRLVLDLVPKAVRTAYPRGLLAETNDFQIASPSLPLSTVTSDMIATARSEASTDAASDRPLITVELNETGRERFAELTRQRIGKEIVVTLDGVVVLRPLVQDAITNGRITFPLPMKSNAMTTDARVLAASLASGRMPAKLIKASVEQLRHGAVVTSE
jgi:hypothetical protein